MIKSYIIERLQSQVGSLVGGTIGSYSLGFNNGFVTQTPGQIYPVNIPTNTDPSIGFVAVGESNVVPMGVDLSGTDQGLSEVEVVVVVIHRDWVPMEAIALAVKHALHCWDYTASPVVTCRMVGGSDLNLEEDHGYGFSLSFQVVARV